MSDPSDLREHLQRGAETVHPEDPPIERIVTRGRRRRIRGTAIGVVVGVVVAVGVLAPLLALSRLGGDGKDRDTSVPAALPGPPRTTAIGYTGVLTAPSNFSLLLWGDAGRYWPQGEPDSQPLFQLSNVDPGLFTAADPNDAWWCPATGGLPAGAAVLNVRVTASSGADQNLPAWPVALQAGSNACGEGQTAAWRVGDSSFDALVAFGDDATDADRQAIQDGFSSMRFDDNPRWFTVTGAFESDPAEPIQVLDGGFLRGTPWLHVAFPEHHGTWLCFGSMYPWDVRAEAAGEAPAASCGDLSAGSDPLWFSGTGCEALGNDRYLTDLSGFADAKVASVVVEMDDGDRWVTTPVAPPPGVDLGGNLWVAPGLTGVTGTATGYDGVGQQVGHEPVDACTYP
jgi:hypothetical protein